MAYDWLPWLHLSPLPWPWHLLFPLLLALLSWRQPSECQFTSNLIFTLLSHLLEILFPPTFLLHSKNTTTHRTFAYYSIKSIPIFHHSNILYNLKVLIYLMIYFLPHYKTVSSMSTTKICLSDAFLRPQHLCQVHSMSSTNIHWRIT